MCTNDSRATQRAICNRTPDPVPPPVRGDRPRRQQRVPACAWSTSSVRTPRPFLLQRQRARSEPAVQEATEAGSKMLLLPWFLALRTKQTRCADNFLAKERKKNQTRRQAGQGGGGSVEVQSAPLGTTAIAPACCDYESVSSANKNTHIPDDDAGLTVLGMPCNRPVRNSARCKTNKRTRGKTESGERER